MVIEPWSVVAEHEALALAGPGATLLTSDEVAYAVGQNTIVVIGGGDRTTEEMAVPGPVPDLVEARLSGVLRPALLAFARIDEGCLALGTAHATDLGYRRGRLHGIRLHFEAPIPPDLLDHVSPGVEWLDLLPDDPHGALERFITGWYDDIPPAAPFPGRDVFNQAAAGRAEVYGSATRIFPEAIADGPWPDHLVAFGEAGDGVFTLLREAEGDDPRVYYHGLSDRLLPERDRLSRFLLHSTIGRAAMDAPLGGMAFVDRAQAHRVLAPLRRVPLRPMRWPCAFSRCYVGPGMAVLIGEDDTDWFEMYVGARHRGLLRRLRKLGLDWESFSD
ncbi:hypothetical protein [Actinoplanes sp. NPDC051851]|uniref:hypothetical protein n=1 Tax=Actinoplanes sp. NPDC051851 TaxID=3154753 RepID=UPI003414481D